MSETRILLVRHPETQANVSGRWVGRGNAPYTALGELQVEAVVARLIEFAPDEIRSSPLFRAHEPARRAAAALGLDHHVDERLNELDFGAAEGLTIQEAKARGIAFDFKAWDKPVAPGGESRADIMARTAEALDDAIASGARVALVTHGGVFRSGLVHLLGLPPAGIWAFHIRNAAVAEIRVGEWGTAQGWGMLEEFGTAPLLP